MIDHELTDFARRIDRIAVPLRPIVKGYADDLWRQGDSQIRLLDRVTPDRAIFKSQPYATAEKVAVLAALHDVALCPLKEPIGPNHADFAEGLYHDYKRAVYDDARQLRLASLEV